MLLHLDGFCHLSLCTLNDPVRLGNDNKASHFRVVLAINFAEGHSQTLLSTTLSSSICSPFVWPGRVHAADCQRSTEKEDNKKDHCENHAGAPYAVPSRAGEGPTAGPGRAGPGLLHVRPAQVAGTTGRRREPAGRCAQARARKRSGPAERTRAAQAPGRGLFQSGERSEGAGEPATRRPEASRGGRCEGREATSH